MAVVLGSSAFALHSSLLQKLLLSMWKVMPLAPGYSEADTQHEETDYVEPHAADTAGQSQQQRCKEREGSIERKEVGEA
jgi:hypothetical protein